MTSPTDLDHSPTVITEDFSPERLILRMIARMEPLSDILQAIASAAAQLSPNGRAALLRVKGREISLAASTGLSQNLQKFLTETAVSSLAEKPSSCQEHRGLAFRTLLSGAGELLGALVVGIDGLPAELLAQDPALESRLAAIEELATLAIEQNHMVDELNYSLEHDSLTCAYDRLTFERRMFEELMTSRRTVACPALIVIGVDRLRRVNSALGGGVGNNLLRQIAQRLERNLGQHCLIGRAGGDEFLVFLSNLCFADQAVVIADRLLTAIRMPFLIEEHELSVTASAGISISSREDYRPEDLEARAFAALERAKSLSGNQTVMFDSSMTTLSPDCLELETKLRGALEGRELLLYYQPQVMLHDLSLVGVEALLRWRHPDLGLVSPGAFIPLAEQGGLITEIGEWTLREALRQLAVWKRWGIAPLRIGVNVSPYQFRLRDFTRRTLDIVEQSGVAPEDLLLEITEGVVMHDPDHAIAQINRLRSAGIRFAIDDFGTGYSALAYLQKIPADEIKVDRSFVQEISSACQRPPLLTNILRLASELGISAIAEGIETRDQADALRGMGCQEGQGFLFSRPVPGVELAAWIHAHETRSSQIPTGSCVGINTEVVPKHREV